MFLRVFIVLLACAASPTRYRWSMRKWSASRCCSEYRADQARLVVSAASALCTAPEARIGQLAVPRRPNGTSSGLADASPEQAPPRLLAEREQQEHATWAHHHVSNVESEVSLKISISARTTSSRYVPPDQPSAAIRRTVDQASQRYRTQTPESPQRSATAVPRRPRGSVLVRSDPNPHSHPDPALCDARTSTASTSCCRTRG